MCEVALLLLKGHHKLRKKPSTVSIWHIRVSMCMWLCSAASFRSVSRGLTCRFVLQLRNAVHTKSWRIPLTQLLFSSAPDDEHREAVIKMGDDFGRETACVLFLIYYYYYVVTLCNAVSWTLIRMYMQPLKDWPTQLISATWWQNWIWVRVTSFVWSDATGIVCVMVCVFKTWR